MRLEEVPTPAAVLDLDVLERNLDRMARRCRSLGVRLRPHVKTHKCIEVGRLQREAGAEGITVSTLPEARAFADEGFEDLTWAFPLKPDRVAELVELRERARPGLLVDDPAAVDALEAAGEPFDVWLELDCGDRRSGVPPASPRLGELAGRLAGSEVLRFGGLLTHGGQAYRATSPEELAAAAEEERAVTVEAARRLRESGVEVPEVSVGSTPGMSAVESLEGVDEARPGNYAFHDYTQVALGACGVEDCALTVLATVVSSQPGSDHCVVDAGALALSRDPGPRSGAGGTMGEIFRDHGASALHEELRLTSLSQEHGTVDGRLPYGTKVRILPNHSCLTAACHDRYHVVRGQEVVDTWEVRRAR